MCVTLATLTPLCSGYYYWTYFANSGGPYVPIPVRYDLNPADPYGLQNNTITYLISSQGPSALMPGDSFTAVISQIRAAAEVWNSLSTSGIRLAFGGLSPMTTQGSSPEIDVVFTDDVTPGLIALTAITTAQNAGSLVAGGASFVPMLRAQIQLQGDLTNPYPQPSSSDAFFLTVAHEFGHALGLQHTKTSSLMTTYLTRSTTKAQPLAADDIAGISLLYPANGYAASTGSIAGSVSMNGGVNLATVTALSTSGAAVSSLTNPDGTYQINGVPPGQYYVYVQPLPPAQQGEAYPDNVYPPQDTFGNSYLANMGFAGQFYGSTTDWTEAAQVSVNAANVANGINFTVQPRSGPAAYDMVLYGAIGNPKVQVQGAPLQAGTSDTLTFYAYSTVTRDGYLDFAPGLNISVIGGSAQIVPNSLTPLAASPPYLYMFVFPSYSVQTATPAALAVTWNGDLYVLPAAFTVVPSAPPTVTAVRGSTDNQGNATVTVTGSNLGTNTRVFFDGASGTVLNTNQDGSLNVAAPPATNGYHASVEALSADGQTSAQTLGTAAAPVFTYNGPASPAVSVSPSTVTAGTDTMVQITGYSTTFVDGQTVVGFGSSDVVVKQLWVVSPGRVVVNVSVSPLAQSQSTTISVASGLQLATLSTVFQVASANGAAQVSLRAPVVNQATQLAGVPSGGTAVINTTGLPGNLSGSNVAGWTLTIGGQPAPFTVNAGPNGAQILAIVPGGLSIGPAVVQLISPSGNNPPPALMQIDTAPPVIAAIQGISGAAVDATHAALAGDTITLTVSGVADQLGILPAASAVFVSINGVEQNPGPLVQDNSPGGAQMNVALPWSLSSGAIPIAVRVGTRLSAPYTIAIH
jgi:hypothetical protein